MGAHTYIFMCMIYHGRRADYCASPTTRKNQLTRHDSKTQNASFVYTYGQAGNILSVKRYAYTTGTPRTTFWRPRPIPTATAVGRTC